MKCPVCSREMYMATLSANAGFFRGYERMCIERQTRLIHEVFNERREETE